MTFLNIEDDRARSLRTVPVCVRRKLAECGLSLDEAQWVGLPLAARRRLADMPVEGTVGHRSFSSLVRWLSGTFLVEVEGPKPGLARASWREPEPPDIGVDRPVWELLGIDARYALVEAAARGESVAALVATLTEGTGGRVLTTTDE